MKKGIASISWRRLVISARAFFFSWFFLPTRGEEGVSEELLELGGLEHTRSAGCRARSRSPSRYLTLERRKEEDEVLE